MGILNFLSKSRRLYYPGCWLNFKYPEFFELYQDVFRKLGIGFFTLDKFICCGLKSDELGYETNSRNLMLRNMDLFKENGVNEIIVTSPCCYKAFLDNYSVLPMWDIPVVNIWKKVLERLLTKPKLIKHKAHEKVTFHDSCYLGRYSGIYEEPRKILEVIGYKIIEMPESKEDSLCCGSCGALNVSNSKLAEQLAKQRILQAKRTGVKKLVVCSVEDYDLLKKFAGDNFEVLELSQVLGEALGLRDANKIEIVGEIENG